VQIVQLWLKDLSFSILIWHDNPCSSWFYYGGYCTGSRSFKCLSSVLQVSFKCLSSVLQVSFECSSVSFKFVFAIIYFIMWKIWWSDGHSCNSVIAYYNSVLKDIVNWNRYFALSTCVLQMWTLIAQKTYFQCSQVIWPDLQQCLFGEDHHPYAIMNQVRHLPLEKVDHVQTLNTLSLHQMRCADDKWTCW
jgi:hypothetical protein